MSMRIIQTAPGTLSAKCDDGEKPIAGFCQNEDGSVGAAVTIKPDGTALCTPEGVSAPSLFLKLTCATGVN